MRMRVRVAMADIRDIEVDAPAGVSPEEFLSIVHAAVERQYKKFDLVNIHLAEEISNHESDSDS